MANDSMTLGPGAALEPPAAPQDAPPVDGRPAGQRATRLVGGYLVVTWAVCMTAFVSLWPGFSDLPDPPMKLMLETRFLALMAAAGALGACLQAVTSFAGYVGNRKFSSDWALWYVSRPPIGATMAVIFLPLVGAGIVPENHQNAEPYAFGLISLGILVGMFSKNATDKLADLFDALMTSSRDDTRGGKLVVETPQILSLTPATVTAGTTALRIQASGSGFTDSTVVLVNGQPRQTIIQDSRTVAFWLDGSDVATAGTLAITPRTATADKPLDGAGVSLTVVA